MMDKMEYKGRLLFYKDEHELAALKLGVDDIMRDAKPWIPPPLAPERREGVQLPKPEDVLDAITDEYVATMQAQGIVIGTPERVAIRRAANIQYAWFCAMRRVIDSTDNPEGQSK